MSTVWSCGGGTQSAAIAALIVRGDLPKPDAAVIADTGREASETWRYFQAVLRWQLARVGVDLVRLPHSFEGTGWNTVDLFGGKDKRTALIPAYTTHAGAGPLKQASRYCSNEWKTRPVERYARSLGFTGGDVWIGFSLDEFERMRGRNPAARWNHAYPLIDRKLTRADCVALVAAIGWPSPPRSACWMCPYRTDAEWLHLKRTDPEDFLRAQEFERELQAVDPSLWLHRSGVALERAELNEQQGDLFAGCDSGGCFT